MQLILLLGAWVLASVLAALVWIGYRTLVARYSVEDFDAVEPQQLPGVRPLMPAEH
jgi:hypothetical protein